MTRYVNRSHSLHILFLIFGWALASGCMSESRAPVSPETLTQMELESPAEANSSEPNLSVSPAGDIYLTWIERLTEDEASLYMARFDGNSWSSPTVIAGGSDWFLNWADFPSLSIADEQHLAAHFLAKSGESTYAYDVMLTVSENGGQTWSEPFKAHRDGTQTEHGFVSLLPWTENRFFATWLDGRNTGAAGHDGHGSGAMTVRAAFFNAAGNLYEEAVLDEKTCDCCQTSAALFHNGIVVAYRNRSDAEIRDISVVRYLDGSWTEPEKVHEDGWEIAGCPVNGPSLAAAGRQLAIAWFTASDDTPKVLVAASTNPTNPFAEPVRIDNGAPLGRVGLTFLGADRVLVSWLESTDAAAEVRARIIDVSDPAALQVGEAYTIALTSPERKSGFPRVAYANERVVFAWTEVMDNKKTRVKTALYGVAESP